MKRKGLEQREKGSALVIVLGLLLLITLMGFASFQWALSEIQIGDHQESWMQSQYLAEAGVAKVLEWFQDPTSFPTIGSFPNGYSELGREGFFRKRSVDTLDTPSFFDERNISQYTGTPKTPDFFYETDSERETLFGDPMSELGFILTIKVFGPLIPGSICTVEVRARMFSGAQRIITVQMEPSPLQGLTAAVQIEKGSEPPVPIRLHWGDMKVLGDADLGPSIESIPGKDSSPYPEGRWYGPDNRWDAWVDFYIGGRLIRPSPSICPDCEEPFPSNGHDNVHQYQSRFHPDFGINFWNVKQLKALAKHQGGYYTTDLDGFLYLNGIRDDDHRRTIQEVFPLRAVGDSIGLVFVDTIDGNPLNETNRVRMDLPIDYLEGIIVIRADLTLRAVGSGRSLRVKTPPTEGTEDDSTQRWASLSGIHLNGVLSVGGTIRIEGETKIFGAVITRGGFIGPDSLEIWYDANLRSGYYRGLPVVLPMKGGWSIQ